MGKIEREHLQPELKMYSINGKLGYHIRKIVNPGEHT
jgi:hypothetical protein